MIIPPRFVTLAALCGTLALAGSSIHEAAPRPITADDIAMPARDWDAVPSAISSNTETVPPDESSSSNESLASVTGSLGEASSPTHTPTAEADRAEASVLDSPPALPPERSARLIPAFPSKAAIDEPLPPVPPLELSSECLEAETCVDEYLWSLYERTPKVDTNKVIERIKKAVKKNGKVRTLVQTITNYVIGNFAWKDPAAAQKADMSLKDYVIGGMDPDFRLKLYRALRIMDKAGLMPGITSAFRDDYRQSIASGNKAASDSSYHGGSRRGGFGHGLAADLVSVKGDTRMERLAASEELWKWIDAHEKELGIGRPYRDRDPPHVGPLDGKEYVEKRAAAADAQKAAAKTKTAKAAKVEAKKAPRAETKKPGLTAHNDAGTTKQARLEKSKVSSLQTLAAKR